MSKAGGRNALITSALIVAGIRMWLQVRGKAKTPFPEWAIGWGATFFILALMSEASPSAAGSLSLIVAVSDFLKNAVNLTADIGGLVTGSEGASSSTFVQQPFSATAGLSTSLTGNSKSPRETPALRVGGAHAVGL